MKVLMPFSWRGSFATFRTGVAPLRLETGRYENLEVTQRTYFICHETVKSERHVLLKCPLCEDLHLEIYCQAFDINPSFYSLTDEGMIKTVAKTCKDILNRRRRFLYK